MKNCPLDELRTSRGHRDWATASQPIIAPPGGWAAQEEAERSKLLTLRAVDMLNTLSRTDRPPDADELAAISEAARAARWSPEDGRAWWHLWVRQLLRRVNAWPEAFRSEALELLATLAPGEHPAPDAEIAMLAASFRGGSLTDYTLGVHPDFTFAVAPDETRLLTIGCFPMQPGKRTATGTAKLSGGIKRLGASAETSVSDAFESWSWSSGRYATLLVTDQRLIVVLTDETHALSLAHVSGVSRDADQVRVHKDGPPDWRLVAPHRGDLIVSAIEDGLRRYAATQGAITPTPVKITP